MPAESQTIVVKIGGSTLGAHDTTLHDLVALRGAGRRVVVVHGGGPEITRWLGIHQVPSRFVNGLRVTDEAALEIVVAVLAGAVNKRLVAELGRLGVRAAGVSGADAGCVQAMVDDASLGLVGAVRHVDPSLLEALLAAGILPVVAPVGVDLACGQLLNVNGDTVAGAIAAALPGSRLVFLTDVAGVLDAEGRLVQRLTEQRADELRDNGVLTGGMLPKIEAGFRAIGAGSSAVIVDGRAPGALAAAVVSSPPGTTLA